MLRLLPVHARFLVLPLLVAAAIGGCRQEPDSGDGNALDNPIANLPSVARPTPPLDRAAILAAVAQAASATAAGAEVSPALRALDGRQFEIRIRFGCRGPSSDPERDWLRWTHDPESRTVRLYARPTISKTEPLVAKLGPEEFEAVEGFWIPRPWLLQPVCPATAAIERVEEPQPSPAGEQRNEQQRPTAEDASDEQPEPRRSAPRVGIAQFFTSTDSRTGRRDNRAYEAVHTLKEGQAIGSQGFNLVLAGRLKALPGRGVIECVASNADSPPECIVSAEVHRAWIEQPETREVIAEWGGS